MRCQPSSTGLPLSHDSQSLPGARTVSEPTRAAMLRESLPPSTATPKAAITATIASQASARAAPSPGSLAAHIQFPLHFTSWGVGDTGASQTRWGVWGRGGRAGRSRAGRAGGKGEGWRRTPRPRDSPGGR